MISPGAEGNYDSPGTDKRSCPRAAQSSPLLLLTGDPVLEPPNHPSKTPSEPRQWGPFCNPASRTESNDNPPAQGSSAVEIGWPAATFLSPNCRQEGEIASGFQSGHLSWLSLGRSQLFLPVSIGFSLFIICVVL